MKKVRVIEPHKGLVYGYLAPLLTIFLFVMLLGLSIFMVYVHTKVERGDLIAQELQQISDILHKIDATSGISAIQGIKAPINFLTVKKGGFIGSEIGSLVLRNPQKWEGPYVPRNIEMEGIPYQILHTKSGYFIMPGDGVKLPDGNVIGKDIIVDENSDIHELTKSLQPLNFNGKLLALPLHLGEQATLAPAAISEDFIAEE